MPAVVDVAVIGAGLSGLQAALDLHQNGRSVAVLEARDRVGGKTWSVERADGKGVQELGAAWLNDSGQSRVWEYVQKFGLTTVLQNIQGSVACQDADGDSQLVPFGELPKFEQSDVDSIATLRDTVEAVSLNPDTFQQPTRGQLDRMTFEQWCRSQGATDKALQTATVWARGTLGQDPNDVSALTFLEVARGAGGVVKLRFDGKHGAQYLRVQEGTQQISIEMAKLLPPGTVVLNSPVASVVRAPQSSFSVVTTASGSHITARKVIVSVPGPAYKNIEFDPPLPPAKHAYTTFVRYGCLVKYICLFKTPWWRELGSCGLSQSFRGPINHCRDTSVDSLGNFALTCFIASTPGRKWLSLSESDQREAVIQQLGSLFAVGSEKVKDQLTGTMVSSWMEDKWAGWGCPFGVPPPGLLGHFEDGWWNESGDGLYFVGTDLIDVWRGYMEGALRSGTRGADQVLADLQTEATTRSRL